MTEIASVHGLGPVGLVGLGLAVMVCTWVLAWSRLPTRRSLLLLALLPALLPAAIALWLGAIPSLHAGVVGTAMLLSAGLVVRKSALKALIIGLGFLGLWAWDGLTLGLGSVLLVAPVAAVGGALVLTATQLLVPQPARPVQDATVSAWILAAGSWLALTGVRVLVPDFVGLADPLGLSAVAGSPVLLATVLLLSVLAIAVLPGLVELETRMRRAVYCPTDHVPVQVSLSAWSALWSGYSEEELPEVAGCPRWPHRRGCDQGCLRAPQ